MKGIAEEMTEDLEDFGDTDAADAVLIGCAQAIEHYEISRSGTLKAWAKQLGFDDASKLLDETLQEEKRSDMLLSKLAEKIANIDADKGKMKSGKNEAGEDAKARKELKGSASDEKAGKQSVTKKTA